jgi:inosine/xanthosine triphosphatase
MRIVLGSRSEDKFNILTDCLTNLGIKCSKVIRQDASSDISEQPLSKEETIAGATNRAKNAFRAVKNTNDLKAIGLEGGLLKKNGIYNLICAAVIYDGKNIYVGISKLVPLPIGVSNHIHNGHEFGVKIREYAKLCGSVKYEEENIEELISRKKSFRLAIHKSFAKALSQ